LGARRKSQSLGTRRKEDRKPELPDKCVPKLELVNKKREDMKEGC